MSAEAKAQFVSVVVPAMEVAIVACLICILISCVLMKIWDIDRVRELPVLIPAATAPLLTESSHTENTYKDPRV